MCIPIIIAGAVSCLALSAQAYVHPCIPATSQDLAFIKASLNQQPWKSGYALLAADSHSQLTYTMQGPFGTVSRTPDVNLNQWKNDMTAVFNLARMWYFTGNTNYAQKAHDILLAWANTQTNFAGQEMDLSLGDYAYAYGGGADILRGTWPGWTVADTATVKNYFLNCHWPTSLAGLNYTGPANKGSLYCESGIAVALFLDDTNKFNHVIDNFRTVPSSGLRNTLDTGEMGETGRDEGHSQGDLLGYAFLAECAWKQGLDLFSESDNRILACGEYYARNTLTTDNPFVPFGTIDYNYYANNPYYYTANRSMLYIIQNAYKNRKGLPTPWIDLKLQQQNVDANNFMYAKTADSTTATMSPASFPTVSLASSGLTLTTLGTQATGRSLSFTNNVWTMTGLGNTVWTGVGGSDDCQFAYQAMTGDCALVAQVTSFTYSGNNNGKCGVMIRDNLSAVVSQRAWIGIIPAATNIMECRQDGWTENWGGSNWSRRSQNLPPGMPYWVKIERRGNMINTYTSQDGTSWAANICSYYGNLPSTVYIGLLICSGTATAQTATFANVAFTGGSGGLATTPAAPAAVFADGSSKTITVRWLPSFGATAYDLLRSTTSGSGYTVIASNLTTDKTSYVDTSVTTNTTYYYVVQAKNSAGTSGNSPEFYGSLLPAPLVNLAFSGTANDSANNPANAGNAFDQNPGSQWFYTGTNGWLQYDFGVGNAQVVKRYTVTEADTIPARDPRDWTFLGSQDGSTWTTLDSQTSQSFAYTYQQLTYDLGNTTAYRYYRINVTANNGDATFLHIGDLGLWGDSGRTIPDGRYYLVSRNSNKVMDAGTAANGTAILQQTYNGSDSQQWDIAWLGNGQYRAIAAGSSEAMDNGGTSGRGANLVVQPWNGGSSQSWTFVPDSDGFCHIISGNSGLLADVSSGSTADGAHIIQWTADGGNNQQWMPSLASGTAPSAIPLAPTGLSATGGYAQVLLNWNASSFTAGYNVKRSTTSGSGYATVGTASGTSYADTAVVPGQTYYYIVTATNSSGESANSLEVSAVPQNSGKVYLKFDETSGTSAADATGNGWNGTLVNGPSWVAGYSNNAVNLSGSSQYVTLPSGVVSNLNDFTISAWVKQTTISTWSRIFDFGTGTSTYMFLAPRNGANNVLRFAITTGGGNGEQRIDGTAALPTNVWTHVAVTLSGSTGVLYVNGVPVGTNSSMTLTPASLGITALNYIGKSQFNDPYFNGQVDEFRIYGKALSPGEVATFVASLAAPTGLTATAGVGQVALNWNLVMNATYYQVFRSLTSGGPYTRITQVAATSSTDASVVNGTTYYYVVSAVNSAGESGNSTQVSATPQAPPAPPTGLVAMSQDSQVGLIWNSSSGATSYNVKRATVSGGSYTTIANVTSVGYTDTGLVNGTTYYYVVSAVNAAGESGNSVQASATPQVPAPSAPTGLAATSGNQQATLSWTASSGATSYNVKRSTTSGGGYSTVANVSSTGCTDTGLANGTTYYYVVSAVNAGGESANSSEVSVTPTDLFGYWNFDEGSGTTAADSGSGGNNGTLQSGASWTTGFNGSAVHLDGSASGYVSFSSGMVGTLNDFSVSCWVKVDTNKVWARVFDFGSGTGTYMFLTPDSGAGTVRYAITTGSSSGEQQLNSSTFLSSGVWHHVAVTLSGNTGVLYLDGTAVNTNSNMTLKPSSLGNTTQNYIGKSQWNDPNLIGNVDDFRIYNRALTATEISALATAVPSPWNTADIGAVGLAGNAAYSNSVFIVTGSGADTWGASDQFRYVYQTGGTNCSITAKVLTMTTNSSAAAKCGVMIRETLATNSEMCEMHMTALNGAENLWRTATGGNVTGTSTGGLSAPYWVRITRAGSQFISYRSPDGVTWTPMSTNTISMANSAYIGLFVCSHNNSALCTATFSNVTASP